MTERHLLREHERGEEDRPPRGDEDGRLRHGDEPLDVHHRDDEAFLREARALVDRADRVEDGVLARHLALLPLVIVQRRLRVQRAVLLAKVREGRALVGSLLLVLQDAIMKHDRDTEDDLVGVRPRDGRVDVVRGGRVRPSLLWVLVRWQCELRLQCRVAISTSSAA